MSTKPFCLSGCGYLEEIRNGKQCLIVRIKVLNDASDSHEVPPDEILLDCEADNLVLLDQLDPMYKARNTGRNVVLHFRCVYSAFGHYHGGLTAEDAQHMALLQAKLLEVGEWYCAD